MFWQATTLPGLDGNPGDNIADTIDWTPGPHGSFFPKDQEVTRYDVGGSFRMTVGPKDEITNVPVVSFAFDIPELLQLIPGTPSVVRVTYQITTTKGVLQPQGKDEAEHIYVDLSPLFTAVENLASYAALRSSTIHRGVLIFKGITKSLNVRPVLKVQISTFFAERSQPLAAYVAATVDYLFATIKTILPVSTHVPSDGEEDDDIPFHIRRGYLKFLLNQVSQKAVEAEGCSEYKEFILC